ncbi:hypothetical protein DPMN_094648 [Dreissena polymorpha]|uniref:Secreted protein n=1 Tax=Dreissena polymorpha TaxID=45954 RepID=A0A9D4R247_DREPO|nr:hypothetical protein DPMN_094648 [Dreissena polymorpha]
MKVFRPTLLVEAFSIVITMRGAAVENKNTMKTSPKPMVALIAARRVLTKASFNIFYVGATRTALRIFGMIVR